MPGCKHVNADALSRRPSQKCKREDCQDCTSQEVGVAAIEPTKGGLEEEEPYRGIQFQFDEVRRAQKSDPDLRKIVEVLHALVDGVPRGTVRDHLDLTLQLPGFWALFHMLERFKFVEEVIMMGPLANDPGIMVPASLREKIFRQLHGSLTSCHFGME